MPLFRCLSDNADALGSSLSRPKQASVNEKGVKVLIIPVGFTPPDFKERAKSESLQLCPCRQMCATQRLSVKAVKY